MESSHNEHHIVPVKYYLLTLISLSILTMLTVYTAKFVDLGKFNIVLAMFIAGFKASLVLLFFMGLRWDRGFNVFIVILTLVFFFVFVSMILFDNLFAGVSTKRSMMLSDTRLL